ncbi:MAG: hypothetical protein GKS06_15680 [Acidobacteria bacterium]|nr:hypothetical protein [Acidobacteriota bacterium]
MRTRIAILALLVAVTSTLSAQESGVSGQGPSFALRAGATVSPDQFHVGFHVDLGEAAPRLRIRPGAEIGFGSDRTTLVGNIDALYVASTSRTTNILVGGGLGLGAEWGDRGKDGGLFGANLIGAVEWGTRATPHVSAAGGSYLRYLLEVRVGLADLPELKVTVGLQF